MERLINSEQSYAIIGICIEVHSILGKGFSEIVYKDALEWEFKNAGIPFKREKEYIVKYKEVILPHKFYADFVIFDEIILEVKAVNTIINEHISQTINYLKVSNNELGLLVNFGESKLYYKRLVN
jgi:GxxExxY protein